MRLNPDAKPWTPEEEAVIYKAMSVSQGEPLDYDLLQNFLPDRTRMAIQLKVKRVKKRIQKQQPLYDSLGTKAPWEAPDMPAPTTTPVPVIDHIFDTAPPPPPPPKKEQPLEDELNDLMADPEVDPEVREEIVSPPSATWNGYNEGQRPELLNAFEPVAHNAYGTKVRILRDIASQGHELRKRHNITTTKGKFFVCSDLHGHLLAVNCFREGVLSNLDAETAVIVGDALDFHDTSFFKDSVAVPLRVEFEVLAGALSALTQLFERVIVVRGNHDMRPAKVIQAHFDAPALAPFMQGARDPLGLLCQGYGFDAYGAVVQKYDWGGRIDYSHTGLMGKGSLRRVGHTIFSHADKYLASAPLATVRWVDNKLWQAWRIPHDCVIQGHTHALGMAILNNQHIIAESGCMSDVPGYVNNAKLKYRDQAKGWIELYQDEQGQVDLRRTKFQWYGTKIQLPGKGLP